MHRVWVKSMVFANTGQNHMVSNSAFKVTRIMVVRLDDRGLSPLESSPCLRQYSLDSCVKVKDQYSFNFTIIYGFKWANLHYMMLKLFQDLLRCVALLLSSEYEKRLGKVEVLLCIQVTISHSRINHKGLANWHWLFLNFRRFSPSYLARVTS